MAQKKRKKSSGRKSKKNSAILILEDLEKTALFKTIAAGTDKITDKIARLKVTIGRIKKLAKTERARVISYGVLSAVVIISLFLFIVRNKYLVQAPLLVLEDSEISFVYGDVKLKDTDETEWEKAEVGDTLSEDMEITTGAKSWADITFNEGTAVRISSDSRFVVNKYTINRIEMGITGGSLFGKFKKLFQDHEIIITSPTTTAAIRGTELGVELIKDKKTGEKATIVYALSGVTEVYNPGKPEEKLLLSYQDKVIIREKTPPSNPEDMMPQDVKRIRKILNSIHTDKVLLVTNKILFETGSARLLPGSDSELDSVAEILEESSSKIRIDGHTDNEGSAYKNQILSVNRAKAVRDYLIKKGISQGRLSIAGYGSSMPIEDNDLDYGRKMNRRVEFVILN